MKLSKTIVLALVLVLLPTLGHALEEESDPGVGASGTGPSAAGPRIEAPIGLLMDASSGDILWSKNAHLRRPEASLTKIMTAILILESGRLKDICVCSPDLRNICPTSLDLMPGERISLNDILRGMLVKSANDAAVAAAEHLCGTSAAFVDKMNEKAKELGCTDTHFVNPNGLNAPGHYSSAADLAKIVHCAIQFPEFNEITALRHVFLQRSINKKERLIVRRCHHLWDIPGADGIKTGYTHQAGNCFISGCTRNGWRLISIILHSKNTLRDTENIIEFGFSHFHPVPVARRGQVVAHAAVQGGTIAEVPLVAAADVFAVAPAGTTPAFRLLAPQRLEAPLAQGQRVGAARVAGAPYPVPAVPVMAGIADPLAPTALLRHGDTVPILAALPALGLVMWYGSGTKNSLRRRARLQKAGRRVDPRGQSNRRREDGDPGNPG